MKKLALLILVALTFTSCSKVPFKEDNAEQNSSLVYIFVSNDAGNSDNTSAPRYLLKIDEKRVKTRISGGEYLAFNLASKSTKFSIVRSSIIEKDITLQLTKNSRYFLKVVTDDASGGFTITEVNEAKGLNEIKGTYLAGAEAEDEDAFLGKFLGEDESEKETTASEQNDAAELERLFELKEKGAITQEEYETLKDKVINKQ